MKHWNVCKTCQGIFVRRDADEEQTCMGTLGGPPAPHVHDPNTFSTHFYCADGHANRLGLRKECPVPDCEWNSRLRRERFTEWPDVPSE